MNGRKVTQQYTEIDGDSSSNTTMLVCVCGIPVCVLRVWVFTLVQ